ncbi:hypothetical protein B0H17DRAFT_1207122 [Mycena rosella]|uniref:Uncharacterized protein n=1 Tax=Mycena rosella TaxID=1033263 RepID=A0AAD7G8B1_MYCRO|nr:hypothetical protein B0H17DRAFT_1207122 [Mycena rosella]
MSHLIPQDSLAHQRPPLMHVWQARRYLRSPYATYDLCPLCAPDYQAELAMTRPMESPSEQGDYSPTPPQWVCFRVAIPFPPSQAIPWSSIRDVPVAAISSLRYFCNTTLSFRLCTGQAIMVGVRSPAVGPLVVRPPLPETSTDLVVALPEVFGKLIRVRELLRLGCRDCSCSGAILVRNRSVSLVI